MRGIRRPGDYVLDAAIYLIIAGVVVATAYPFWHILMYSFSDPLELRPGGLLWPAGFSVRAYQAAFSSANILHAFLVSAGRSTIGPVISCTVSMMVAYALSRRAVPGRRFFSTYFILTMYFSAGLIPTYLLIRKVGLTGSFLVYVLPRAMDVFGMILMRTYIETLPGSLEESAYLDGANELHIFSRIVVPLCTPVIAAIMLFSCVWQWNSYVDTLIYNFNAEHLYTLQYVLVMIVSTVSSSQSTNAVQMMMMRQTRQAPLSPMVVRMAITVITIVPISVVYPFLQRYFIKGILVGAVKG
jgi:putative aldouronate transport system permease protein